MQIKENFNHNFKAFCEILERIESLRQFFIKNSSYYLDSIANNNEIQFLHYGKLENESKKDDILTIRVKLLEKAEWFYLNKYSLTNIVNEVKKVFYIKL